MTDVYFYHLLSTPLERALPKLLEKALQGGFRVHIKTASDEAAETLSTALWSYDPGAFLPHGTPKDGREADQPIYLTPGDENPNAATLCIITDGSTLPEHVAYARLLDMFDGTDDAATKAARERWKAYQARGFPVTYVKQTEDGGWTKTQ